MQHVYPCIILLKVNERKVTLNGEPGTCERIQIINKMTEHDFFKDLKKCELCEHRCRVNRIFFQIINLS